MSEPSPSVTPAWVRKRDGRLEPFDADKICQSLFAATEEMGEPNAFLARELTDAVAHFLSADVADAPLATEQIAGQVIKIVRELGQPALAQAFAHAADRAPQPAERAAPTPMAAPTFTFSTDETPADVTRRFLATYSEHAVFSRDLVSAQGNGLVLLAGLEAPQALAAALLELPAPAATQTWWAQLPALCEAAGQRLVLDGPEWSTLAPAETLEPLAALARRSLVVNLNSAQPPAATREGDLGPLFAGSAPSDEPALDRWIDAMAAGTAMRWDWHLQARDFTSPEQRARLTQVAQHAVDGRTIAFVFDRPRRPIALAEGMDRSHPAVLMEVGLDLVSFLRLPDVAGNPDAVRRKLPSLARMAVSAGAQKRRYLRRHAEGTQRGFLLDRARLAVVPLGLDAVVRSLTGTGLAAAAEGLDLARKIVQILHDSLEAAGAIAHLDVALDSAGPGLAELIAPDPDAGLSCTDAGAAVDNQLRAAGELHAIAGHGTATIHWPHESTPSATALVELLHWAWRKTAALRVVMRGAGVSGGS